MNLPKPSSPKIEGISWGSIIIEGLGNHKDYKLWPGGGRPWDWNESNTNHRFGIQPADVIELIDHGCTTIVLSQGMFNRLAISSKTIELLKAKNITFHTAKTKQAVKLYNKLANESVAVGGLFHTTC